MLRRPRAVGPSGSGRARRRARRARMPNALAIDEARRAVRVDGRPVELTRWSSTSSPSSPAIRASSFAGRRSSTGSGGGVRRRRAPRRRPRRQPATQARRHPAAPASSRPCAASATAARGPLMSLPRSLRARLLLAFLVVVAAALGRWGSRSSSWARATSRRPWATAPRPGGACGRGDPRRLRRRDAAGAPGGGRHRDRHGHRGQLAVRPGSPAHHHPGRRRPPDRRRPLCRARRDPRARRARPAATTFNEMAGSLEATERRRLQLVGDVAHELRTR